jgi:hypothetical protein
MPSFRRFFPLAAALALVSTVAPAQSGTSWTKWRYDGANTGWNPLEKTLNTSNVRTATFGKKWSAPVDGQLYAQPLYVAGVKVGHASRDLVFVATEHDSVYALDAATGAQAWRVSLGTPVPSGIVGCGDLVPEYGITSTPVIDAKTATLYVVAKTLESGQQLWRLHALDLATGAEQRGWGFVITATIRDTAGLDVTFAPQIQLSRSGLLLANGVVYVAFGSHCDIALNQYHGWVFGYETKHPGRAPQTWNATPDGAGTREAAAGIWMSGASPALGADGSIWVLTGNGPMDVDIGGTNVGDAFVRLDTRRGREITFSASPIDYFSPSNQAFLDSVDADLGSGGIALLPDQTGTSTPHLLVGGGKDGTVRLLNRDDMGGFAGRLDQNAPDGAVQDLGGLGGFWSTPAYWGSDNGHFVYVEGIFDTMRQLRLGVGGDGRSVLTQVAATSTGYQYPSATPVVSSDAGRAGTGIVWTIDNADGALHAHDAANVATELWSSNATPADAVGGTVKFTSPAVADGRVLVGGASAVSAYGLR